MGCQFNMWFLRVVLVWIWKWASSDLFWQPNPNCKPQWPKLTNWAVNKHNTFPVFSRLLFLSNLYQIVLHFVQYCYIRILYCPLFSTKNCLKYTEHLTFVTALYFINTRDKVYTKYGYWSEYIWSWVKDHQSFLCLSMTCRNCCRNQNQF